MTRHKISVYIIASHRDEIFKKCILSVLASLPEKAELVTAFNGAQPSKLTWLKTLSDRRVSWFECENASMASLRNRAFEECSGDIIYYLDDDTQIPSHLFTTILDYYGSRPTAAIVGGPNLTPPTSPFLERLFGAVLTSPFAAPFVFSRYAVCGTTPVSTKLRISLCNMAIKRTACPPTLRFAEGLYPNEETLFIHRARRLRLSVDYLPQLYLYHHRRTRWRAFALQILGYGSGRAKQTLIDPLSFPLPFLFLGIGISLLILISNSIALVTLLYFAGAMAGWLYSPECRQLKLRGILAAPFLSITVHSAYTLGFLKALVQALFNSEKTQNVVDFRIVQPE